MTKWPVVLVLILSGCGFTPQGNALRAVIAQSGVRAMDEALTNAEWIICRGASIGAVQRRYAGREDVYRAFCVAEGSVIDGEARP